MFSSSRTHNAFHCFILITSVILETLAYVTNVCPPGIPTRSIRGTSALPLAFTNDIIIDGECATLRYVSTTGSILVVNGGKLISTFTSISGSVIAEDMSSSLYLGGNVSVGGSVELKSAGGVTILSGAMVTGELKVVESGSSNAALGGVDIRGSTTLAGISVEKSFGPVRISSVLSACDVTFVEHVGDVSVSNSLLSDVSVSLLSGGFYGTNLNIDSDCSFSNVQGAVTLRFSEFSSNLLLESNMGAILIEGNDSNFNSIEIIGALSDVTVSDNINFSLSVIESSGSIEVANNSFEGAEVSKNTGDVTIVTNVGISLTCVDNSPLPTGFGNVIETSFGDCAAF